MKCARAFTLVEMVVVVGVIILLAGLTLSVGVTVVHQSEVRQTRAAMSLLDSAVQEWELRADRKLIWWDDNDAPKHYAVADVHGDTEDILIITELLNVIMRTPSVSDLIAQIDPRLVYTYRKQVYPSWIDSATAKSQVDTRFDGELTVLDAWGMPIYATHPGRPFDAAHDPGAYLDRDPDGTIQTSNEKRYGITTSRRVCFVSAGPDGSFGDVNDYYNPLYDPEHAADNLYSYPVQPP